MKRCPYCKDMRFISPDVPVGHPDFGRAMPCPMCSSKEVQVALLDRFCGLSPEMKRWSFEMARDLSHQRKARAALMKLIANPQGMIALIGPNGVGKTYLSCCLCNAARRAGYLTVWTTTAELLQELRNAFAPDANVDYEGRWRLICEDAQVLALDEFNAYSPTPWAAEKFAMLLDARYRHREEKLTILAGTLQFTKWPNWLRSRFRSRLCQVIEINGPDIRPATRGKG